MFPPFRAAGPPTLLFLLFPQPLHALLSHKPNPIRKVVTLLEDLKKEVETESADAAKLFEKFECECKKTIPELSDTIAQAKSKIAELQSTIQERAGSTEQLKTEIKQLSKDLAENKASLKDLRPRTFRT